MKIIRIIALLLLCTFHCWKNISWDGVRGKKDPWLGHAYLHFKRFVDDLDITLHNSRRAII